MSSITLILEPDADGTVHLPVPVELRHRKVKVEAKLQAADAEKITPLPGSLKDFDPLKGRSSMLADLDKPLGRDTPKPGSLKGFWMSHSRSLRNIWSEATA